MDSQDHYLFGNPESQGSILAVHNNGGDGIFVANGSLTGFWGAFAGTGTIVTISASNNGGSGIALALNGNMVSPFGAAHHFRCENNPIGLNVGGDSSALISAG